MQNLYRIRLVQAHAHLLINSMRIFTDQLFYIYSIRLRRSSCCEQLAITAKIEALQCT